MWTTLPSRSLVAGPALLGFEDSRSKFGCLIATLGDLSKLPLALVTGGGAVKLAGYCANALLCL